MRTLFSLLWSCLWAGAVAACPNESLAPAAAYRVEVTQLLSGATLDVLAGGPHRSSNCPGLFPSENVAPGHYAAPADFLFEVVGLEGHRLMLEVSGGCDTMLMVSANGHRFYDDDDAGDLQPQITLTRPRSGLYHVWVGTYEPDTCDAMLTIRAVPQ